jgi:hypothetical protein
LAASLMAPGLSTGVFEAYLAGLMQNVGLVVAFRLADRRRRSALTRLYKTIAPEIPAMVSGSRRSDISASSAFAASCAAGCVESTSLISTCAASAAAGAACTELSMAAESSSAGKTVRMSLVMGYSVLIIRPSEMLEIMNRIAEFVKFNFFIASIVTRYG